ncbi:MAG: hypothetical protein IPK52_15970 [Chloroflexi bacterium]|nr:hypothetical protein [Chloroflexota bacterium]
MLIRHGHQRLDLANNYGPPPDQPKKTSRVLTNDHKPYRDELIVSTKAAI